jgi:hypothetical protein
MKTQTWITIMLVMMLAAVSVAGALAANDVTPQTEQHAVEANTLALAETGPLAQVYTGGVVVLLGLLAIAPLALGSEPGAGINA